jgi:hypothetical protein
MLGHISTCLHLEICRVWLADPRLVQERRGSSRALIRPERSVVASALSTPELPRIRLVPPPRAPGCQHRLVSSMILETVMPTCNWVSRCPWPSGS